MAKKDKNNTKIEDQNVDQVVEEPTDKQHAENKKSEGGKGAENSDPEKAAGKVKELEKENSELRDKYLRLLADFENYKKRNLKERLEMMKTAAQDTMVSLLPVLDDFDRAKKNAEDDTSKEYFSEGVSLVYNKLYAVLTQQGLEPMETNGEVFDPELHEAVTEIPAPSEELKGKIVDTIEKGYLLKGKIIRHAKVVVGK